jgi:hypothetical protein
MRQPIPDLTARDVYRPRNPRASDYYKCVASHFEELEQVWDDQYAPRFGFWRPHVMDVIQRYLDCGDLHCGFARVKCADCGHEYLLGFSCKKRQFCPSCHQKRVVEYGEWLLGNVLKDVPHRQWVFSIPKRLRIYFLYDRKLLSKLSRCGWNVIRACLGSISSEDGAKPGATIAVHTYGDFLNYNPHIHAIVPDGCFLDGGDFRMAPWPTPKDLGEAFRHEVLSMLKKEGKITDAVIENMMSWHHSGFHVHIGERIWPDDEQGLENLARYIVHACFSQERMVYIPVDESADGAAKVIYTAKDGRTRKTFDALDWLAHLVTHVPGRYEQTVRYYGYYSNKSRGLRKKAQTDDDIPVIVKNETSSKEWRQNWARLIQKIYKVNPLICPKCQGEMKIIAFIEDEQVIKKILKHLGLWETHNHDPPIENLTHIPELTDDDDYSQLPAVDYWLQ